MGTIPTILSAGEMSNPVGRPSSYSIDVANKILHFTSLGFGIYLVSKKVGVPERTLRRWLASNAEFREALDAARNICDDRMVRTLYEKASGYTIRAVRMFMYEGQILSQEYDEHIPPDARLIEFWLKNRRPNEWREKQSVEHLGTDGKPIEPVQVVITLPDNGYSKKD